MDDFMDNVRIYGVNIFAILFSGIQEINPYLQTIVLILTIIYTSIQIIKKIKSNG